MNQTSAPPRRWIRRALLAAGALLAVLLMGAWLLAPRVACWWLQRELPWQVPLHNQQVRIQVEQLAWRFSPVPRQIDLEVTCAPTCLRRLANGLQHRWWLPPGVVRSGLQGAGILQLPALTSREFHWVARLNGDAEVPVIHARVRARDLNAFLDQVAVTPFTVQGQELGTCRYQVDQGTISADQLHQPRVSGQDILLAGRILLDLRGLGQVVVEVSNLRGHARWTIASGSHGQTLACHITILDATMSRGSALVGRFKDLLLKELEQVINDALERSLEQVVVPPEVPTEAALQVEIVPEVPAPAAQPPL